MARSSLSRTWDIAAGMARANRDALSGIAGMFILLPAILSGWALPERPPMGKAARFADIIDANATYILANWPAIALNAFFAAFGSLAILVLLLDARRPTVREALPLAMPLMPIYLMANVMQSAAVTMGLVAFVLPGLYLLARFVCIAPVLAGERPRNPLLPLRRSLAITQGRGWRILLMLAILFLVVTVLSGAATALVGVTTTLLLSPDLARLTVVLVQAFFETALGVVVLLVSAAIYRESDGR